MQTIPTVVPVDFIYWLIEASHTGGCGGLLLIGIEVWPPAPPDHIFEMFMLKKNKTSGNISLSDLLNSQISILV